MACWRCAICRPMADDIAKLRRDIDGVDDELLRLLNQRAALASRVGGLKKGAPAYRPEREAGILRRMAQANPGPLAAERVTSVVREHTSACRGLEEASPLTYLRPDGTLSEQAARQHFRYAAESLRPACVRAAFRHIN